MKYKYSTHDSLTYLLLALWLLLLAACAPAPEFESIYSQISESTLQAGDDIPVPQEDVILTVTGKIGQANNEASIVMDLPTIESLGVIEYEMQDPFENEKATFRGVLMKDLLQLWQIDEDATTIEVLALNDYSAEIPIASLQEFPVMFALQQNGEYMKPNYRGPSMLIFPYDHYEFERPLTDSYWVWQIKAIKVK